MKAGPKTAQKEQAPKSSAFRVSVWITFANVSLAKKSQRAMQKNQSIIQSGMIPWGLLLY